jgi:hypothetical protein
LFRRRFSALFIAEKQEEKNQKLSACNFRLTLEKIIAMILTSEQFSQDKVRNCLLLSPELSQHLHNFYCRIEMEKKKKDFVTLCAMAYRLALTKISIISEFA